MQNFGLTNKEHYGMLSYFLEWPILMACKEHERSAKGTPISNDRDDRRIFGGLKFSFSGFFLIGKLGKYFFGSLI